MEISTEKKFAFKTNMKVILKFVKTRNSETMFVGQVFLHLFHYFNTRKQDMFGINQMTSHQL